MEDDLESFQPSLPRLIWDSGFSSSSESLQLGSPSQAGGQHMAVAASMSGGRAHGAMCGGKDSSSVCQPPVNKSVSELKMSLRVRRNRSAVAGRCSTAVRAGSPRRV